MQPLPLAAWLLPLGGGRRKLWTLSQTRSSMEMLFGEDLHLARVRSLANGVAGVLNDERRVDRGDRSCVRTARDDREQERGQAGGSALEQ
jgi:hypothetical protein